MQSVYTNILQTKELTGKLGSVAGCFSYLVGGANYMVIWHAKKTWIVLTNTLKVNFLVAEFHHLPMHQLN